jgi:Undecaprenyl-phosphate glucose phosphotransferase
MMIGSVTMKNLDPATIVGEHDKHRSLDAAGELGSLLKKSSAQSSARYWLPFFINLLKISDIAVLLLAGFGGFFVRFGFDARLTTAGHLFIYLSTLVIIVSLHCAQAYREREILSLNSLLGKLGLGFFGGLSLIMIVGYLSGTLSEYSRVWVATSACAWFVLLLANRLILTRMIYRARMANMLDESIIVVGANERAELIVNAIKRNSHANIRVLGVFDDRVERGIPASLRQHMLGSTCTMLDYIRTNPVDRVVVALPWLATERVEALLKKLRTVPVRIDLVPNNVVWQFPSINMERLAGVPVLTIANSRIGEQMGRLKRIEDLVISSILLALVSPVLAIVALAIKFDSPGPVIFKQRRHGFNNQEFEVWKFRSMKFDDCASAEVKQATRFDSRVTRVGGFLRRSSLDELPQLFNVLFGHMSIVGPRPHAIKHNLEFGAIISEYYARHNVKPGITGWAQVNGFRGETDTLDKMQRRVEHDLHYIEHWSLTLDLKILVMTAFSVWFHKTAY